MIKVVKLFKTYDVDIFSVLDTNGYYIYSSYRDGNIYRYMFLNGRMVYSNHLNKDMLVDDSIYNQLFKKI